MLCTYKRTEVHFIQLILKIDVQYCVKKSFVLDNEIRMDYFIVTKSILDYVATFIVLTLKYIKSLYTN